MAKERDRTFPASAAKHYRNLCVYFRWLLAEDEIKDNPMLRVEKPKVAEEAKPCFSGGELAALLKITNGPNFETLAGLSAKPDVTSATIAAGTANLRAHGGCGVNLYRPSVRDHT